MPDRGQCNTKSEVTILHPHRHTDIQHDACKINIRTQAGRRHRSGSRSTRKRLGQKRASDKRHLTPVHCPVKKSLSPHDVSREMSPPDCAVPQKSVVRAITSLRRYFPNTLCYACAQVSPGNRMLSLPCVSLCAWNQSLRRESVCMHGRRKRGGTEGTRPRSES